MAVYESEETTVEWTCLDAFEGLEANCPMQQRRGLVGGIVKPFRLRVPRIHIQTGTNQCIDAHCVVAFDGGDRFLQSRGHDMSTQRWVREHQDARFVRKVFVVDRFRHGELLPSLFTRGALQLRADVTRWR